MKRALIVTTVKGFVPQFEMNNVRILQQLGYEVHYVANYKMSAYGEDNKRLEETGIKRHQIDFVCFPYEIKDNMFDIVVSAIMLVVFSPVFLILAIAIRIASPSSVFYRQERVTTYRKRFRIHKFRTMVNNADRKGSLVTVKNGSHVTRVGKLIRKSRLDEVSQLIDVLLGDITFVGTRSEVTKYVERYAPVMMATLLLLAGITSEASILYKDEDKLLDDVYVEKVFPGKMYYNLRRIEKFSLWGDIGMMLKTMFAVLGKGYEADKVGEAEFVESILRQSSEVTVQ